MRYGADTDPIFFKNKFAAVFDTLLRKSNEDIYIYIYVKQLSVDMFTYHLQIEKEERKCR